MQLKKFLYKLFFLIFILFFYNSFAFGISVYNQNHSNFNLNKKNIQTLKFLKKNECFSFLKFNKNFFSLKEKIIIGNDNFIGFFQENRFKMFHIVKSKDTLYSIAKNSGHNYYELSKFNFIKKPYKIIVGQKIWVGDFFIDINKHDCSIVNLEKTSRKEYNSCEFIFKKPLNISNFLKNNIKYYTQATKICFFYNGESEKNNNYLKNQSFFFSDNWYWPVNSRNIQYFYSSAIRNKKIEISGFKGQPIFAAAAGEVVFVTDLFKKYGQLIIIRHNKNYLSIYAFNDSVLVKQRDRVYAKQQISTMGVSSDNNLARLYFEIRYQGESVNPLNILPKINKKK